MYTDTKFSLFSFIPSVFTNVCVNTGTMPPKGTSSSKQVPTKGKKMTPILISESTETSSSSGDHIEYPMKGKVDTTGKRP